MMASGETPGPLFIERAKGAAGMGVSAGLVLAAAATMVPVNTILLIERSDLPEAERSPKLSAGAVVNFMVDAAGYTLRCTSIATVGDEALASRICPAMMHRWHRPARRANGEKVAFVGREFVRLLTPGTPQSQRIDRYQPTPDLELKVAALPGGKSRIEDFLYLEIDEHGQATDCLVPTRQPYPLIPSSLPQGLCRNLAIFTLPVERDGTGKPVRYITSVRVRLTAQTPGGDGQ